MSTGKRTISHRLGSAIDGALLPFFPSLSLKRREARARAELAGAQYKGAEHNRLFADWVLGTDKSTPSGYELQTLRNRSRDLRRNDAVASGAVETIALNVVGTGLRPQAKVDIDALKISREQGNTLNRQLEAIFRRWWRHSDAGERLSFGAQQYLVACKGVEDGEVLALPVWKPRTFSPYARCIELVESERLKGGTGFGGQNGKDRFKIPAHGIVLGPNGEPTHYNLKHANTNDTSLVSARDKRGRPRVLHIYPMKRPGQVRGVPLFAPVFDLFKNLGDYLEAEVVAARVAACLAVFVKRTDPNAASMNNLTETTESGDRIQEVEPGMVGYLGLNESIDVLDPKRPGDSFDPFVTSILRFIAQSLQLPYELLVKDFSKTNYSSARAALLEGRRFFSYWRNLLAEQFCQPVYELVIEEAWVRGELDVQDFWANKDAICAATWIGPGWGWVDPEKEVESSRLAVASGLSTWSRECAALGEDWEVTFEQLAREQAKAKELGLNLVEAAPQARQDAKGDDDA